MKNKVLIGVIVVLIGVIAFEGYYIFSYQSEEIEPQKNYINIPNENDDIDNDNTDDNIVDENPSEVIENGEDYVRLVNTREEDNQIVQEYEMVLNGERQEFEIVFTYDWFQNDAGVIDLVGNLNSKVVYSNVSAENFNISYVNEMFSENNFTIIEGNDKNYLLVATVFLEHSGMFMNYDVYNDDLNYIDSITLYVGNQSIENDLGFDCYQSIYADIYGLETNYYFVRAKIEDNKIYSLHYYYNNDYCLDEGVYTIDNDKLNYEPLNTYSGLIISGAV